MLSVPVAASGCHLPGTVEAGTGGLGTTVEGVAGTVIGSGGAPGTGPGTPRPGIVAGGPVQANAGGATWVCPFAGVAMVVVVWSGHGDVQPRGNGGSVPLPIVAV